MVFACDGFACDNRGAKGLGTSASLSASIMGNSIGKFIPRNRGQQPKKKSGFDTALEERKWIEGL